MSAKHVFCGVNGTVFSPTQRLRKFCAKGGPCLTAYTPAFGLGCSMLLHTSPTAKTSGMFVDSKVALMFTKPFSFNSKFVSVSNHFCAFASVHHTHSLKLTFFPDCKDKLDSLTSSTPSFSYTSKFLDFKAARIFSRADVPCPLSTLSLVTSAN